MLIEIAIGDAVGAGFEFDANLSQNTGEFYSKHSRHAILPGAYTDDTQMSIAIAEAMISKDLSITNVASKFVECYKRDPRLGYASRFQSFLDSVVDADDFLNRIVPNSDKSGAAMRACPIGVLKDINQVVDFCTLQAKITHNTPNGILSAVVAALATHYCLYDLGAKDELGQWLNEFTVGYSDWDKPWHGKVDVKGIPCVHAAIDAVMRTDNLNDCLIRCINFTGDTDTVAAIALGIGSHSWEMKKNLNSNLYDGLENGKYGKDYIIELDKKLFAL